MMRPFAKLMEMVEDEIASDADQTIGQLAKKWGEEPRRVMDAIDANKVVRGEKGYIG